MEKILKIEGMHCIKCAARVEKALMTIQGVQAKVDLAKKEAEVVSETVPDDSVLRKLVSDQGFEVVQIL